MLLYATYIKLELFITTWCVGLYIAATEGNLLYKYKIILTQYAYYVAKIFKRNNREELFQLRDDIMKPIIACPDCMASVHSAIIYTTYKLVYHIHFQWMDLLVWLSLAVPGVFFNVFLWSIIDYFIQYAKALKNNEKEEEAEEKSKDKTKKKSK